MNQILKVEGISKSFGSILAINNISFDVSKGQVLGVLGPNGSGKTTTLAVLLSIKFPDTGSFVWFEGEKINNVNTRIGTLLEVPFFYPYLNLIKNLEIVSSIRGCSNSEIFRVLELVGLSNRARSAYYTLSLGMKQRLAIASALLGNPEVLVLDEPTNGLDPEGIAEVRELITNQSKLGKTIIMASHILAEVEKVCSHVVILKAGKRVANGKVDELIQGKNVISASAENMDILRLTLEQNPMIDIVETSHESISFTIVGNLTTAELNKWLIDNGVVVSSLELHRKTLETLFLELVKEK